MSHNLHQVLHIFLFFISCINLYFRFTSHAAASFKFGVSCMEWRQNFIFSCHFMFYIHVICIEFNVVYLHQTCYMSVVTSLTIIIKHFMFHVSCTKIMFNIQVKCMCEISTFKLHVPNTPKKKKNYYLPRFTFDHFVAFIHHVVV